MNVTIIGAGAAGLTTAGHMTLKGHKVTLWDRSLEKVQALKKVGSVTMEGVINDTVQLSNITNDLEEAVKSSNFLSIMTTCDAYESIAVRMAPYLENGQKVLLNSAGIGGALLFQTTVRRAGYHPKITIGETDCIVYVTRHPNIGKILIKSIKNKIHFTALPLNQSQGFLDVIHEIYPQFQLVHEPLAIGVWDTTCFHTAGFVLNAERIKRKESFNFYIEGITPEIADYMEMQDKERIAVAQGLGVPTETAMEWLNSAYGVPMADLYTMIQNNEAYKADLLAPTTFQHRFILEEVPSKLVPQLDIARILGISQPLTTEIANKACELVGIDLFAKGRTLEKLGLTEEDIHHCAERGLAPYLEEVCI